MRVRLRRRPRSHEAPADGQGRGRSSATSRSSTSDNPRSETPERILADIEAGIAETGARRSSAGQLAAAPRGYHVCSDRKQAIALAIGAAQPGDSVLIAGKGHEKYQIIGTRRDRFDDCEEARSALAARGARG